MDEKPSQIGTGSRTNIINFLLCLLFHTETKWTCHRSNPDKWLFFHEEEISRGVFLCKIRDWDICRTSTRERSIWKGTLYDTCCGCLFSHHASSLWRARYTFCNANLLRMVEIEGRKSKRTINQINQRDDTYTCMHTVVNWILMRLLKKKTPQWRQLWNSFKSPRETCLLSSSRGTRKILKARLQISEADHFLRESPRGSGSNAYVRSLFVSLLI